ncbi:MAG TPA: hypothetical protein VFZ66_28280 [Herpetosiphonaceae bacterium]
MLTRPRIRQLGLGELLDESFRLYRSNFLTFVAITALILVPYTLISFIVQYPLQEQLAELQNQANSGSNPFGQASPFQFFSDMLFWYVGLMGLGLFYTVIFQPLLEGALAHGISQRYLGRETGVGESFGAALRRGAALIGARLIPTLIGAAITGGVFGLLALLGVLLVGQSISDESSAQSLAGIAILGMLGLGLLAVISVLILALLVRIFFTSQAVMVEGQGAWSSLVRSWHLTQGYFWRTVGYLLVILLLMYFLVSVPAMVIVMPTVLLNVDPRIQLVISSVVSAVFSVIATPFSMISYTLMYFDLRIRKEGFDLEQQASTLLAPGPDLSPLESR